MQQPQRLRDEIAAITPRISAHSSDLAGAHGPPVMGELRVSERCQHDALLCGHAAMLNRHPRHAAARCGECSPTGEHASSRVDA